MSVESDDVRWVPVGEVGEVRMGKQLSPASKDADGQMPYLRVANVFEGRIDYSDVKTMGFTDVEKRIYELRPGDILLNEGQESLFNVGRSAIYEGGAGEFCFQNTLIRFRSHGEVFPEYAQEVFVHWRRRGLFANVAEKTSISHLGGGRFARMLFPLVSLDWQRRIVEIRDSIVELERVSTIETEKMRTLQDGTLENLLRRHEASAAKDGDDDLVSCGQVIKMAGGFPLAQARPNPAGRYPILSSGGVAGRGDREITGRATIVIGRVGEGAGSVFFVPGPAWVTDNALWVKNVAPGWIPEFLSVYLQWYDLRKLRSQTGQPLVTQGVINEIGIPRFDLAEQQRIVRVHQAWAEQRGTAVLALRKLRQLRDGVIDGLLSRNARPAIPFDAA